MREGFFRLPILVLGISLLQLSGCASLFVFDGEDDPSAYDRGYEAQSDECTGRFCDTETDSVTAHSSSVGQEKVPGRIRQAIETRDIILGMTRQDVLDSWGEPVQREVAGKGDYGNERWIYGSRYSFNGVRTVFFENGRVAGWNR